MLVNNIKRVISVSAITLTLFLNGCVISINDDPDTSGSWQDRQSSNSEIINQLQLGTSITAITDELGLADDSEGFSHTDGKVVVLYYRTRHQRSDGKTTRDETTPLVFLNGELVGWGEAARSQYLQ